MNHNMKRLLSILLALAVSFGAMVISPATVFADGTEVSDLLGDDPFEAVTDDGLCYAYKDGNAVITGYDNEVESDLVIPASIEGNTVVGIAEKAFKENQIIGNVTINAGITVIPSGAFQASSVRTVVLPDSIEDIQSDAFANCADLETINIPGTVSHIGMHAFTDCVNISGTWAFDGVVIEEGAFGGTAITGISLSNSTLDYESFTNCSSLVSVSLNNTELYENCFSDCTALENLTILNMTGIASESFSGCTALKKVVLPSGLKTIESGAFRDCTVLSGVYIPSSVTTIANDAFYNDWLLNICGETESYAESYAGTSGIDFYTGSIDAIVTGTGSSNDLRFAYSDSKAVILGYDGDNSDLVIPDSIAGKTVTALGARAFENNKKIENVTVNANISVIPFNSFEKSTVKTVVLPDSITDIQDKAFIDCYDLETINIPETISHIGLKAFQFCFKLSGTLTFNGAVIEDGAFTETAIRGLSLSNCTLIRGSFHMCGALETVDLYNTVINGSAFYSCTALESLTMQNVGLVFGNCFRGCTSLKTAVLSEGLTTIKSYGFQNCTSLSGAYIPSTVTSIEEYAFTNDSYLFISTDTVGSGYSYVADWAEDNLIPFVLIRYDDAEHKENGEWTGCIDGEALEKYDGSRGLYIMSKDGMIWFNANAVANITKEKHDSVHIGWMPVKDAPNSGNQSFDDTIEEILNNGGKVFNFNLSENALDLDDRSGKIDFGGDNGGGADLTIPIEAGLRNVNVYYVDENGSKTKVRSSYDRTTGAVTFHTSHFSYFSLEEDDAIELDADEVEVNHSATLTENFAYNYYFTLGENGSDFSDYSNVWLELNIREYKQAATYEFLDENNVGYNLVTKELTDWSTDTSKGYNRYKFTYTGIAAAEIGNLISATLHMEKEGQAYYTPVDSSSIKNYAYNRIEKSDDANLKSLLVDMLNYCAEAQSYFHYNETQLVNAGLTNEQKALGTQVDVVPTQTQNIIALEGTAAGFINSKTINLGSSIELKYYMTFGSVDLNNVKLVLTYQPLVGDTQNITINGSDFGYDSENTRYYAKLTTIAAADTGSMVSATLYETVNEVDVAISDTLEYGIEVYCKNRLSNPLDEALNSLLRKMLKYTRNAANYFMNQS